MLFFNLLILNQLRDIKMEVWHQDSKNCVICFIFQFCLHFVAYLVPNLRQWVFVVNAYKCEKLFVQFE